MFGPYEFRCESKRVAISGRAVVLTPKEFELALRLFQNLNLPVSREQIAPEVRNRHICTLTRTIDTYVSQIRSKLELGSKYGYPSVSIYSYGYRMAVIG